MMRGDDAKLLAELARLVARHGPSSFSRLATLIRDPEQAEMLAELLDEASSLSTRRTRRAATRTPERIGMGVLRELRKSNPEKHALIAAFRHDLLSRSILPTMNHLRNFALVNDVSIGKASSRSAAITPLLRSLSMLPADRIHTLRESLTYSETNDRSLEAWRNVIVKQRPDVPPSANE